MTGDRGQVGGASGELLARAAGAGVPRGATVTVALLDVGVAPVAGVSLLAGADATGQLALREPATHGAAMASLAALDGRESLGTAGGEGSPVRVLPVRVATGSDAARTWASSTLWLARGVSDAARLGARVSLTTIASEHRSGVVAAAFAQARRGGMVHVAMVGDGGEGVSGTMFPGSAPSVVGVGSAKDASTPSGFNSAGDRTAVLAVGERVASGDAAGRAGYGPDDRAVLTGSAVAAARAAGVVARLVAQRPTDSPAQIERSLRLSAVAVQAQAGAVVPVPEAGRPAGDGWTVQGGFGVVSLASVGRAAELAGDVNGDGRTDASDMADLLRQIALGADVTDRADLNADGRLDAADVDAWMALRR